MNQLKTFSRIGFGVGIAGIGLLHFIYPGFRPVMLPIPIEATENLQPLIFLTGALLVSAGTIIAVGKNTKNTSVLLGIGLFLFFILGHLPNRLTNAVTILGAWTDALKLLALSGGAFVVSAACAQGDPAGLNKIFIKIASYGKYFFAIMLVIFGIDHFVYVDFVKQLVPAWIPGNLFWTYVAGVALAGSGLAIILNFKLKTISFLLGVMLLLWLILLHIPRAIIMDASDGNEIISAFECLAFSSTAFLLPSPD